MKRFFLRILNAVFPGRADDELAREVASHLAMLEGEGVRRGMTREEARLAARRAFGGVEHTKDLHRDVRSFVRLDDLRRDVQYGARTLRHTPGFTAIAVLTLALGIGANTAIFSVVNGVLLRPLPYKDPQRLVRIVENISAGDTSIGPRRRAVGLNLAELVTFRSKATTLSHAGVYVESTMTLAGRDESIRLTAIRLSPAFFSMLGVSPLRGRTFESREETPGADGVVVLSYSTWQRYFGGAPDVLSRSLTLDGRSFAVVGVMPSDFQFPDPQTQLWIPYALSGAGARLPIIARIADGATVEAASAEVGAILRQLPARSSRQPSDQGPFELENVQDQLVAPVKPALRMLTAAVGFVLLIACINVANLMLARTAARQREIAVRLALGASRGRLIRQLLTESTMLALLGGAAGTGLAFGGLRLLQALGAGLPRGDLTLGVSIPRLDEIGIDLRVLAFTLAIALLTGVLFGLAPAARHSRSGQTDTLREGSASSAGSGFNLLRGHRLQGLLIVAEIAMAMLLLVGGGLMIRSFVNLSNVDPGYNPAGLLTFQVFSPRARPTFADDLLEDLHSLPRVRAAGYAEMLPMLRFRSGVRLRTTPGFPTQPPPPPAPGARLPPESPDTRIVSREFLSAMGMRVIAGRGFGENDRGGQPHVMLINRTLERSGYLGDHPIGTRVYAAGGLPWEVVGIVDDVHQYGLDREPDPQIFIDVRQLPSGNPYPYYAVRADGDPTALTSRIRSVVRELDSQAIVDNVAPMRQLVSNSIARPRLYAVLLGIFAGVAAALAAIGTYGVLAYSVTRRTREIGIRVALGAQRGEVLSLVLRQSAVLTIIGLGLGLAGAAAVTRYLEGLLFGLTPLDPVTFGAVTVLFAAIATVASYVPARRAATVDPLIALRCE